MGTEGYAVGVKVISRWQKVSLQMYLRSEMHHHDVEARKEGRMTERKMKRSEVDGQ